MNKRFTYLYETTLHFNPILNEPKYFDCYLQEKKNTYMFFLRDSCNISLFGLSNSILSCMPEKVLEVQYSQEQSSKLQGLNLAQSEKDKFQQIESNIGEIMNTDFI
jgi:hypothetical protein